MLILFFEVCLLTYPIDKKRKIIQIYMSTEYINITYLIDIFQIDISFF